MKIEEIKKNLSVLDQVLSKSSVDIEINITQSQTAQSKILKKYRQFFTQSLILAIVFGCLWIGNVSSDKLPNLYKAFISIMSLLAGGWYMFLFFKLKNINISQLSPTRLFSETTTIKILTLTGEIFFGILLAVFFTLFLSEMSVSSPITFWLTIGTLIISLAISFIFILPKYLRLFHDLNSIKE